MFPIFTMFFLYTIVSYMIYVQFQISYILPLGLELSTQCRLINSQTISKKYGLIFLSYKYRINDKIISCYIFFALRSTFDLNVHFHYKFYRMGDLLIFPELQWDLILSSKLTFQVGQRGSEASSSGNVHNIFPCFMITKA